MVQQFESVMREVAGRYAARAQLDAAFRAAGSRLAHDLDQQDAGKAALAVNRFVRGLSLPDREQAARLERELLKGLGMRPPARLSVEVDGAIAVLSLRNYVRYLSVCAALEWSDAMHFQSAVADLASAAEASGGAGFTFEVTPTHIACLCVFRHGSAVAKMEEALAGVDRITLNVETARTAAGIEVRISVEHGSGSDCFG